MSCPPWGAGQDYLLQSEILSYAQIVENVFKFEKNKFVLIKKIKNFWNWQFQRKPITL